MRVFFIFILIMLIGLNAWANYNIGNMTLTGVGTSTASLISGNIGVGSSNPGGVLDVEGTTSIILNGINNNGANVGIASTSPGSDLDVGGTVRILNGGNLGIGTANPGQALDIGGTYKIRDVGIGTTVPQELCRKADGTFGYFNGAWASVCN